MAPSLIGSVTSVAIFTVLALGELIADKLPQTPNRTAPLGLTARILTGGLTGACVAVAEGAILGAVLGAVGGIVGCFGGYQARTGLVNALGMPAIYIALVEDLVAVAGCAWVVTRF